MSEQVGYAEVDSFYVDDEKITPKIEIAIPYRFTPRDYQLPIMQFMDNRNPNEGGTSGVAVWHRRAGKDRTFFNILIKEAVKIPGIYYYLFPTYSQGEKILWEGFDHRTQLSFLDHIPLEIREGKPNNTSMSVKLKNRSLIRIIGTDKYDSIRGVAPIGAVFSEYSEQDPAALDVLRPIFRENKGWKLFNFTPKGHNHAYDIFQTAQQEPNWFCQLLTVDHTRTPDGKPVVSAEDIVEERRQGMDEAMVQQEFYCSFEAGIPGAYFREQVQDAREKNRFTRVGHYPGAPVNVWFDLGWRDKTAMWFQQNVGRAVHIIDYYEDSQQKLEHYINHLINKRADDGYLYGRIFLPHDADAKKIEYGKSAKAIFSEFGFDVHVVGRLDRHHEVAIQAGRRFFPLCWFDADKCRKGIYALMNYRSKITSADRTNKIGGNEPVHDWASHASTAFMYMAMNHSWSLDAEHSTKKRIGSRRKPINHSPFRFG